MRFRPFASISMVNLTAAAATKKVKKKCIQLRATAACTNGDKDTMHEHSCGEQILYSKTPFTLQLFVWIRRNSVASDNINLIVLLLWRGDCNSAALRLHLKQTGQTPVQDKGSVSVRSFGAQQQILARCSQRSQCTISFPTTPISWKIPS